MVLIGEPAILEQVINLYEESKYAEAYSLLEGAVHEYRNWAHRIYEIRLDLAAIQGNLDLAEDILEEALDKGYFYTDLTLRRDSDVKELQGRPRYEALVEKSLMMLEKEQNRTCPELIVQEPTRIKGMFLMALHGNNSNSRAFTPYWGEFVKRGWLVALPQSSQVVGNNLFVWNDMEKADRELQDHYKMIVNKYKINPMHSIVSGFSKGGSQAIRAVVTGILPAKGFIAVTPYVGEVEQWKPLLDADKDRKFKGVFILGGKDKHCTPGAIGLYELMIKNGFECLLETFPEMGHEFPDNYDDVLENSAAFLLK